MLAGVLLLVSGFFDLLDGAVARSKKMMTPFGGFLDSVLDRYSDLLVMLGISIHFLRQAKPGPALRDDLLLRGDRHGHHPLREGAGRGGVDRVQERSFGKAREDHPAVGGLFFNVLRPVVVILAVLTHLTVIQRVLWRERAAAGQLEKEG